MIADLAHAPLRERCQWHGAYAYYANENTPGEQAFVQRQLIVNGQVLGRYGATADHSYDGTVFAQMGTFFKSDSEFSFGYQPINGNYPAGSLGTYAVAAGDTLQTIAKGAYGDANLCTLWRVVRRVVPISSMASDPRGPTKRRHSVFLLA